MSKATGNGGFFYGALVSYHGTTLTSAKIII